MKRKHFIALFCLLVLCIQVLPVRQIGALLSNNQINEELPHNDDSGKDGLSKFDPLKSDPFISHSPYTIPVSLFGTQEYFHFAISLPACHSGEIHTPPPNYAA
jgi:hypothetical protein